MIQMSKTLVPMLKSYESLNVDFDHRVSLTKFYIYFQKYKQIHVLKTFEGNFEIVTGDNKHFKIGSLKVDKMQQLIYNEI